MKIRMMLVDDEERQLSALRDYFEIAGFDVDSAGSAAAAAALLDSHVYDVVIADLRLSSADSTEGLGLLRQARARDAKTILLSAVGTAEVREQARRQGVDAILQKPQPLAEVARVVRDLLGSS